MRQRSLQVDAARAATQQEPLVVLVAGSVEERVRVVTRLGDAAPLLVVSSAQEAAALLAAKETSQPPAACPSHHEEPVAHVRADWRHTGLRLVEDRRAVATGTCEVTLTPLEFGVLRCLLQGRGQVRSFAELSRQVWDTSHVGDGSQVHAVVKRLRRKLTEIQAPVTIQVVRGTGFRAVPVRQLEAVSTAPRG